jgi:hypothetical protein
MAIQQFNPLEQEASVPGEESLTTAPDFVEPTDIIAEDPTASVFDEENSYQEASLAGDLLGAAVSGKKRTAAEPELRQPVKTEPGDFPKASEELTQRVEELTPEMPVTGKPSETVFNLDKVNGPDELKQHIEAVAQAKGLDKLESVSFDDVTRIAEQEGYGKGFVKQIIDTNRSIKANPKDVYKMMLVLADAQQKTFDLAQKVKAANESGTLSDDLMVEFRQALHFEGLVASGAKRKQADVARALAILNKARTADVDRGINLKNSLDAVGGRRNTLQLVDAILDPKVSVGTRADRQAALAESVINNRLKDAWFSTWINGLLSNPVTHVKNITGNGLFFAYEGLENTATAIVGIPRRLAGGGKDAVHFSEIWLDARSSWQGFKEGIGLGWEAFTKNKQITGLSKLDYRQASDPFNIPKVDGESTASRITKDAIGLWGKFVTSPGRALMAEDEFFKALNFRVQFNREVYRRSRAEYEAQIAQGTDPASAKDAATTLAARLASNPDDSIIKAAMDHAGEMTFTKDLEGKLKSVEDITQNPFIKMYVPFVRTPTNIALEIHKRLPLGVPSFTAGTAPETIINNLPLSRQFKDDFLAGGMRRDRAIARIGMSSMALYAASNYAIEGGITGAGPYNYRVRQTLEANGWQPYSIAVSKDFFSSEQIERLKGITTVSMYQDKYMISYAGMEPVGAVLGIGASIGEYSFMSNDMEELSTLFQGAVIAGADYAGNLPMLAGISEMTRALSMGGPDGGEAVTRFFENAAQQVGEFVIGGSPLGAQSSAIAALDRTLNPGRKIAKDPDRPNIDADPVQQAFYDAFAGYVSRNPLARSSLGLEPLDQLDPITGEIKDFAVGPNYANLIPYRVKEMRISPAHQVMGQLMVPMYQVPKKLDGVRLSERQRNEIVQIATSQVKMNGKTLEVAIASLPYKSDFQALLKQDTDEAAARVSDIISDYYEVAKNIFMESSPEFIDAGIVKEYRKKTEGSARQRGASEILQGVAAELQ